MREELSAGMNPTPHTKFQDSFAEEVWRSTYKYHEDETIDDTLKRVARAIASVEETDELKEKWTNKFYDMLSEFKALPGGRTIANAGAEFNGTTLANCFVSPRRNYDIDSIEGILEDVLNQCQTLKSEGGWGQNFSFIRPRGAFIHGIGVETPGAIKYMEIYDKTSDIITSGSGTKSKNKKAKGKIRKGAMMAILDDWHPDVEEFIRAKQTPGRLTKFNVSVNLFMKKLLRIREIDSKLERNDFTSNTEANKLQEEKNEHDKWYLRFPDTTADCYKKDWDGDIVKWETAGNPVKIYKTVSITGLWNMVMESTYQRAEPGVIFLDRGNYFNPLNYKEKIVSTNPSMPAGTLVHTKKGIFPIDKLEGNKFNVKSLDGKWSEAECRKSGENKPLLEISFGKNRTIKSTTEHRWPVLDTRMQRIYKADAKDLKIGDLIPLNRNENIGIYGDMSLTEEEGFLIG